MTPLRQAASLDGGYLSVRIFSILRVTEAPLDPAWPLRIASLPGVYFSLEAAYGAIDRIGTPGLRVSGQWRFLDLAGDDDRTQAARLAEIEAAEPSLYQGRLTLSEARQ
jgi:hypothetical protein